jgi:hypothetical protein
MSTKTRHLKILLISLSKEGCGLGKEYGKTSKRTSRAAAGCP